VLVQGELGQDEGEGIAVGVGKVAAGGKAKGADGITW
jgi:hypothetical protein